MPIASTSGSGRERFATAGVLTAVLVGLVACSSTIDMPVLQKAISDKIAEVDLKTTSVDCPPQREAKAGDTFTCTAVIDNGVSVPVTVVQKDGKGALSFDVGKEVFSTVKVVPQIETDTKNRGASVATVTCPKGVALANGSGLFICEVTADDAKLKVTVPVLDGIAQLNDLTYAEVASPGITPETPPGTAASEPTTAPPA